MDMRRSRSAFTRLECLAAFSVIAFAIALSIPVVSKRKALGAELVCAQKEALLSQAQFQYMGSYKGQYAGINTSGAYYQGLVPGESPVLRANRLLGNTSSATPVSTWDWFSPLVGASSNFSPNRALRTQQIFSDSACPSNCSGNSSLYGSASDRSDFEAAFQNGGFRNVSYLQPAAFHLYSSLNTDVPRVGVVRLKQAFPQEVADSPAAFSPRLFNVGTQPSIKIMHADGTRYVNAGGVTDFDISTNPSFLGNHTDYGAASILSNAYDHSGLFGSGYGHKLSFRHASGKINAAFFDGSVRSITKEEAWTEAKYWYPGGSTFTGNNATPESLTRYTPGTILP